MQSEIILSSQFSCCADDAGDYGLVFRETSVVIDTHEKGELAGAEESISSAGDLCLFDLLSVHV